jgi:DNA invertase Pin-like site-specific DNA recombinase
MSKVIAVVGSKLGGAHLEHQQRKIGELLEQHKIDADGVEWLQAESVPAYDQILNKLLTSNIEAIYCTELTRITRDHKKLVELIGTLAISGTKLFAVQMSQYDLMSQPGMLRLLIGSPLGMVRS